MFQKKNKKKINWAQTLFFSYTYGVEKVRIKCSLAQARVVETVVRSAVALAVVADETGFQLVSFERTHSLNYVHLSPILY